MTFADVVPFLRQLRQPLTPRARLLNRVAWAAAILYVGLVIVPDDRNRFPHDLYQFWVTARALETMPIANIYSPDDQKKVTAEFKRRAETIRSEKLRTRLAGVNRINYTGTPMLLAALNAMGSGDFEVDLKRFRVMSGLLYGGGLLALAAALGISGAWTLAVLVGVTHFFWPYLINMIVVNVSAAQAGALMLVLAMLRGASPARQGLIGLLLGLLNLLKPTLAPAAILLLVNFAADRRWRETLWCGGGLGVAAVLGLAIPWFEFGTSCTWGEWRAAMPAVCFTDWGIAGSFLFKLAGLRNPPVYGLFTALLLGAGAVMMVRTADRATLDHRNRWVRDAGAGALGVLIALLASPIVRSHYFMAALPAALIALRPGGLRSASAWRTMLGILSLFLLAAHPWIRSVGLSSWPNHSLWTFWGTGILAGLLIWDRFQTLENLRARLPAHWHQGPP